MIDQNSSASKQGRFRHLVQKWKVFRRIYLTGYHLLNLNNFQLRLKDDVNQISKSKNMLVFADKINNLYTQKVSEIFTGKCYKNI